MNRLVTMGMGPSTGTPQQVGLVTSGFGGTLTIILVQETTRPIRLRVGQSGTKRRLAQLEDVIAVIKLRSVNGVRPDAPIDGWIKVKLDQGRQATVVAEHIGNRPRMNLDEIKVIVNRVLRPN